MTRAWPAEYNGVRVSAVAPGPVYTPTRRAGGDDADTPRIASHPEEIAEVIAFLASARANYITGVTIAVDGGRRAV
jgi:NAD(P)-dependent dehydrogenase (short-subunit alcohol dehydrogenase family)